MPLYVLPMLEGRVSWSFAWPTTWQGAENRWSGYGFLPWRKVLSVTASIIFAQAATMITCIIQHYAGRKQTGLWVSMGQDFLRYYMAVRHWRLAECRHRHLPCWWIVKVKSWISRKKPIIWLTSWEMVWMRYQSISVIKRKQRGLQEPVKTDRLLSLPW